jgi:hypothetical protein
MKRMIDIYTKPKDLCASSLLLSFVSLLPEELPGATVLKLFAPFCKSAIEKPAFDIQLFLPADVGICR